MKFLPIALALLLMPPALAETLNELTDSEKRSGWTLLFDGATTDGWRNYKKDNVSDGWKVIDGALVRSSRRAGDIMTMESMTNELSWNTRSAKAGTVVSCSMSWRAMGRRGVLARKFRFRTTSMAMTHKRLVGFINFTSQLFPDGPPTRNPLTQHGPLVNGTNFTSGSTKTTAKSA